MDGISEEPKEHCLPEGLKEAGVTEKRQWFHQQLYSMLNTYITDSVESLKDRDQEEEEVVRCCEPACNRTSTYRKCRTSHEQNTHSLFVEEETIDKKPEDGIFNYGCLHISLGLLISDAEDAVKEGDRDRLIRVWKFLTFLYCLNGENKYAFASLQEGPGTRISRDLHLEKSEGSIEKIIIGTRCNLAIEKGKGHLPTRIRAGFSQIF